MICSATICRRPVRISTLFDWDRSIFRVRLSATTPHRLCLRTRWARGSHLIRRWIGSLEHPAQLRSLTRTHFILDSLVQHQSSIIFIFPVSRAASTVISSLKVPRCCLGTISATSPLRVSASILHPTALSGEEAKQDLSALSSVDDAMVLLSRPVFLPPV